LLYHVFFINFLSTKRYIAYILSNIAFLYIAYYVILYIVYIHVYITIISSLI